MRPYPSAVERLNNRNNHVIDLEETRLERLRWCAEAMQDAADRIEAANVLPQAEATPSFCNSLGHDWNWLGSGRTFCRRCGLETHP